MGRKVLLLCPLWIVSFGLFSQSRVSTSKDCTEYLDYNFSEALEFYSSDLGAFRTLPLFNDSLVVLTRDGGGTFNWWLHGIGQTEDLTHPFAHDWLDDRYPGSFGGVSAGDWFNGSSAFHVDSVSFYYTYRRDNPNPVPDTLFVYIIHPQSKLIGTRIEMDSLTCERSFNALLPFDHLHNQPDTSRAILPSLVIKDTILLSFADTGTNTLKKASLLCNIMVPADTFLKDSVRSNLFGIAFQFKTGLTYNAGDTLVDQQTGFPKVSGNALNVFRLLVYEEKNEEQMFSPLPWHFSMGHTATSEERYSLGGEFEGYYRPSPSFEDSYSAEHVYLDWRLKPIGATFDIVPGCAFFDWWGSDPFEFEPCLSFMDTTGTPDFLWDFGDGDTSSAASPSHFYTTEGYYNVTLRVIYKSDTFYKREKIYVPPCVLTREQINWVDRFSTFPNPVSSYFDLEIFFNERKDFEVSLESLSGERIAIKSFKACFQHHSSWSLPSLETGLYVLRIRSSDKSHEIRKKVLVLSED